MSERLKKIIDIASHASDSNMVEVWTSIYVAKGHLVKEKTVDGIVSLHNVDLSPLFCDCEPECKIHKEWLNIFEDQVISFSAIR